MSSREADVAYPAVGVKPSGVHHSAGFGRWGATMLSLEFGADADTGALSNVEPGRWLPSSGEAQALIASALRSGGSADAIEDICWDLVGSLSGGREERRRAPRWLQLVRERLLDDPQTSNLQALADDAGVHRVHLSRRFQSFFGVAPSVYRSRCMASRAVARALQGARSLSDVAAEAGFSDQSHMTRMLRAETGMTPAQLRNFFNEVASVQDGHKRGD